MRRMDKTMNEQKIYSCNKKPKVCFCVGPENCNDLTCPLVKRYREKLNKAHNDKIHQTT